MPLTRLITNLKLMSKLVLPTRQLQIRKRSYCSGSSNLSKTPSGVRLIPLLQILPPDKTDIKTGLIWEVVPPENKKRAFLSNILSNSCEPKLLPDGISLITRTY